MTVAELSTVPEAKAETKTEAKTATETVIAM
jgi:hypothetical protein